MISKTKLKEKKCSAETDRIYTIKMVCFHVCACGPSQIQPYYLLATPLIWSLPNCWDCDWQGQLSSLSLCRFILYPLLYSKFSSQLLSAFEIQFEKWTLKTIGKLRALFLTRLHTERQINKKHWVFWPTKTIRRFFMIVSGLT